MKKLVAIICLLATIVSMSTLGTLSASASGVWVDEGMPVKDHAYTFVFVGDTQTITIGDVKNGTKNLNKIYDWIVENKEERKIEFVFGLGDITDTPWRTGDVEYEVAIEAINKLNGVVPYSLVRGNHDQVSYNKFFKNEAYISQFNGEFLGDTINNSYRLFEINNQKFLFMTLDFGPDDAVLEWANGVLAKYPKHAAIITTHGYLDAKGNPLDDESASFGTPMANNGVEMWEKCFSKHENILMVVCGHVGIDGVVTSYKRGEKGNMVTGILVDPQGLDESDPTGLILLMNVSADGRYYSLEYYSTIKEKYKRGCQMMKTMRASVGGSVQIFTTDATTAAATTTEAQTTATTTAAEEEGGCSSAIVSTVSAVCMIGTSLAAFALRKKQRED